MKFLENLDFSKEQITTLNDSIPQELKKMSEEQKKLVINNISYLKELGIENYKEIYLKFYDMFLLDFSTFKEIFDRYEKEDLIEKLKNSVNIVEYL